MDETILSTIEETENPRLARASVNLMDMSPYTTMGIYLNTDTPDKMGIPAKWPHQVKLIRFFYKRDPIISTVVDKSVDIGINEVTNNRSDSDDETMEVYDYCLDDLHRFLKVMAREYLLSGLVIAEVNWTSKEITLRSGKKKVVTLPDVMWLRDPSTIVAKKTPIPNRIKYFVEVDNDTIQFVLNGGIYPDGRRDLETFKLLKTSFPDFVRRIKAGEIQVPLENPFCIITRAQIAGDEYPTPYIYSVLEPLQYKRRLRKMDYAIAGRVNSAIQLFKLGDKDFPMTGEQGEQEIQNLQMIVNHNGRENNPERVFQLYGNHTLDVEWVFPDTQAMLDIGKYEVANQDIMFGLGFPRILLSGETEKSATSNPEFAMFSPSESLRAMRNDLMPFVEKLYKEIARLNDFDKYPVLEFSSLHLFDVEKMGDVIMALVDKAGLSKTSALKIANFKWEDELLNKEREIKEMKEKDIPEFPAQPFSAQPQVPGKPQPSEAPKKPTTKKAVK
jgi:hypothetical protein